jgi:hypothetical protein
MLRKLMPPLLLLTAIVFVFVTVSNYVQKVRFNIVRTEADYFHLAMALIMALAGAVAIRAMLQDARIRRDKSSSDKPPAMSHERTFLKTIVSTATTVRTGFAHRPWVMTLISLFVLAIPPTLRKLSTGRSWNEFTHIDWIFVGFTETPMFLVAAVALFKHRKSGRQ